MDPLALLLADSRFPSGSYAHSLGLEQAVADGLTDVPAFIRARLRLVAEADARFAVEARRAAATAASPIAACRLDASGRALTPSPVLRDAARRLGAQLLRSAATVWPGDAIARYRVASRATPRPIALGVVAAAGGRVRRGHGAARALRRRRDRRLRRAEAAAARPRRDRALARRAGAARWR